jgi:hypothetical protein
MKEYGYKVCYREIGKNKIKIHLICNSYDLAKWEIQYYENSPQHDRKTRKLIVNPEWYLMPVRTFIEYKWLWRGCPF